LGNHLIPFSLGSGRLSTRNAAILLVRLIWLVLKNADGDAYSKGIALEILDLSLIQNLKS
jgi:hypothetical protein